MINFFKRGMENTPREDKKKEKQTERRQRAQARAQKPIK
jgi:hypothetical protein